MLSASKEDWRPIESAPKDDTEIIIWLGGSVQKWKLAHFRNTRLWGPCWEFDGEYTVCTDDDVLWWMPAPDIEPPPPREYVEPSDN